MIKLYICCLVLLTGIVKVGLDINIKFHQEVMEIVRYDIREQLYYNNGNQRAVIPIHLAKISAFLQNSLDSNPDQQVLLRSSVLCQLSYWAITEMTHFTVTLVP